MADICFEGVGKAFGNQQVLRGFSACITPGQRVALLGPSGAGKTTLLRLLLGLDEPDEGSVNGVQGQRFACVFQEDRLCEDMDAAGNVALVLPRGSRGAAQQALQVVGLLGEDLEKPVRELSGGQRRRVALVRAVLAQSDVLILDEAFNGLDEATRQKAFAFIEENLRGRTLVVVTHDEAVAGTLCRERIEVS